MREAVLPIVCVLAFVSTVTANTGFFAGSGQTITLTKTEQVQLVSEDVTIRPNCGWRQELDTVDYRCKFVLKNLSQKLVKAQVGFPLDSQFVQQSKKQPETTELVLTYHFIVRDDSKTYHIRFVRNDSQKKYFRLFLWDMEFDPGETRVVHVAYRMPMSEGLSSSCKPERLRNGECLRHKKRWHASLELSVIEHFHYVTDTGRSWAGPIERAIFRVEGASLLSCLGQRPILPPGFEPPLPQPDAPAWQEPFTPPVKAGPVYASISPEGGKVDSNDGTTAWEYRDYKPREAIHCMYYVLALPRTAGDCDYWVRHVLGDKPAASDLAEMREIAAAFYGIAPQSDSAKEFVERQVWYHPKDGLREVGLTAEQKAVLARLDAIAKGAR